MTKPDGLIDWRDTAANRTPQQRTRSLVDKSVTTCRFCHKDIVWGLTKDDATPCDAVPTTDGNVLLVEMTDGSLSASPVGTKDRKKWTTYGWALFSNHKKTCAFKGEWSKPGAVTGSPVPKKARKTVGPKRGRG